MSRNVKTTAIPAGLIVILWSSVAAWMHLGIGVSGYEIAVAQDDRRALSDLGDLVRERVWATEQSFDVVASPEVAAAAKSAPEVEPLAKPATAVPPAPTATVKKPEVEPALAQPTKQPEPPKPEVKIPVVAKPLATPPMAQPPQPKVDRRIAVRQHVKPAQDDNPSARFLGDEANHVDQEQVATITSHDRDDERPTPSGNHQNASRSPGDSENARVAESEAHRGDRERAPGERGAEVEVQPVPQRERAVGVVAVKGPESPQAPRSAGDGRPAQASPVAATQADPGGAAAPAAPEVQPASSGNWSFNLANPNAGAGQASTGGAGSSFRMPQSVGSEPRAFGLGGRPSPGHINLNLTQMGVIAVVGQEVLARERRADGERRLSEHRGSFQASNFERWRSAIENYVSSVKPGNQTALNTAASPFATYINGIHGRIHPIFADTFLGSLTALPRTHALSDPKLLTRLEIVLSSDGRVMRMGIVKPSGVTAFDIAALDSVQRASPFGAAPGAIVSPDGQVYLHWEFHRDEVFACSTMNAHPFILNAPPSGAPSVPAGPFHFPGKKSQEPVLPARGTDVREGAMSAAAKDRRT